MAIGKNFINFKDIRIDLALIQSYEKRDNFNYATGAMVYEISVTTKTNRVITYENLEERERDFETLDNYMENFANVNFINKRN